MNAWPVAVLLLAASGCSAPGGGEQGRMLLERRAREVAARADSAGRHARPDTQPIALWLLPHHYDEISGLALEGGGRLLAHGDENSEIWEIDYRRGIVTRRFTLGEEAVTGDFEAIALAEGKVFLLESKGRVYEARDPGTERSAAYNEFDTRLKKACEFEAMAYDSAGRSMVLACKHVLKGAPDDALVMYRWPLPNGDEPGASAPIIITNDQLRAHGAHWKKFEASDMTRDPRSGHFLVLSSLQQGIVELAPDLSLLAVRDLPPGRHRQPEGIAVTPEGWLLISDEAAGHTAMLTVYPPAAP